MRNYPRQIHRLSTGTGRSSHSAVPAPGVGWCAWCREVIEGEPVDNHGTRYHVGCWARRGIVLDIHRVGLPIVYQEDSEYVGIQGSAVDAGSARGQDAGEG